MAEYWKALPFALGWWLLSILTAVRYVTEDVVTVFRKPVFARKYLKRCFVNTWRL